MSVDTDKVGICRCFFYHWLVILVDCAFGGGRLCEKTQGLYWFGSFGSVIYPTSRLWLLVYLALAGGYKRSREGRASQVSAERECGKLRCRLVGAAARLERIGAPAALHP